MGGEWGEAHREAHVGYRQRGLCRGERTLKRLQFLGATEAPQVRGLQLQCNAAEGVGEVAKAGGMAG
jgi:hypothetical protein